MSLFSPEKLLFDPTRDTFFSGWAIGFWIFMAVALSQFTSCTVHEEKSGTQPARNDTVWFPAVQFRDIVAYRLREAGPGAVGNIVDENGGLNPELDESGKVLSPAHRADVGVALAMSGTEYRQLDCFLPGHALVWMANGKPVSALKLSFSCNTYRFEPPSTLDLRDVNLDRLRLVFKENGLLGEDQRNFNP